MNTEPLSAETERSEEIDILKFVHQSQKTESLQHRQNLFNAFAAWVAILLAIIGAVIATGSPSPLDEALGKHVVSIAVSVLSGLVIAFMRRQRIFAVEGLKIAQDIEQRLGLFEKGRYLPGKSVLPEHFAKPLEKRLTLSDWFQIGVVAILTLFVWITLFLGT